MGKVSARSEQDVGWRNELKSKLKSGEQIGKLTHDAVELLVKSIEKTNIESTSTSDKLFRSGLFLCGKSKKMRRLEQISSQFEESLDIRSFLSMQKNFSLLMSVLLSKE